LGRVKKTLSRNGILSLTLPYTSSIPPVELKKSVDILLETISAVFKNQKVFYDEDMLVIASDSKINSSTNQEIISKTKFLSDGYVKYLLSREVKVDRNEMINHSKKPLFFLYSNLYELSKFYPEVSSFLSRNIRYISSALYLIIIAAVLLFIRKNRPSISMFLTSFSAMSIELLSILLFQLRYGYIYKNIVVLISLFMIGSVLGIRIYKKEIIKTNINTLMILSLLLALSDSRGIIYLSDFIAGFINGHSYARLTAGSDKIAKKIYITDILGGVISTVIVPFFFVSVFGVNTSIILIAVLNLIIMF
jgi:spermidine synthase